MDIARRWGNILENVGSLGILGKVKAGKCRLAFFLIADDIGQLALLGPRIKAGSQQCEQFWGNRLMIWAISGLRKLHNELRYLPKAPDKRAFSHAVPWYQTPPYA